MDKFIYRKIKINKYLFERIAYITLVNSGTISNLKKNKGNYISEIFRIKIKRKKIEVFFYNPAENKKLNKFIKTDFSKDFVRNIKLFFNIKLNANKIIIVKRNINE